MIFKLFLLITVFVTGLSAPSFAVTFKDVCPPFCLKDEQGKMINPVRHINCSVPYSPKQTCGAVDCHSYDKITRGYHFQQGKNETAGEELKKLYQWVLSPGMYGGRW